MFQKFRVNKKQLDQWVFFSRAKVVAHKTLVRPQLEYAAPI